MSVMVVIRIAAQGEAVEQVGRDNAETLQAIAARAKEMGCRHHQFYASDNGEVVVVDEWESGDQFQKFFADDHDIPQIMAQAGVTSEPQVSVYRKLDVGDEF